MSLPNTLKDLQSLCAENGLKYKGKTKAQLKDLLEKENVSAQSEVEDYSKYTVGVLKEICSSFGLSKNGNKDELV